MTADATPDLAQLVLRYRAGSDVLTGAVETTAPITGERVAEQPDTDTTLTWQRTDSVDVLADFQVLHAAARWQSDRLSMLPEAVVDHARAVMTIALDEFAASDSPVARLTARVEQRFELPLVALERDVGRPDGVEHGLVEHAQLVATSLRSLSTALEASVPESRSEQFTLEAERAFVFCRLLEELAGTLEDGDGLAARGTSAAVRAALRGGLPITLAEHETLRTALTDIDEPSRWPLVAGTIAALAAALEAGHD